ncbi:MAG: hypothetical protein IKU37_02615 [Candidatus Gastranaerophilales bacterium]|nr:hypothetical protein [Candidatus Gastranaerophilales bacterium]
MTNYLKYYNEVKAQKQIDKLTKKYKNKKIVIYGAGIMSEILFKNFDLSKLNIVAICDKKYETTDEQFRGYKTIKPTDLREFECDAIFVLLLQELQIIDYLKDELLINTLNENIKIEPLIKIPFLKCIKYIFS